MDILLTLVLILLAVAVVGHGLWLLGAALWRLLFGSEEPQLDEGREPCIVCGRLKTRALRFCPWCGVDGRNRLAVELADLQATQRQMQRLRSSGTLDEATHERLQANLNELRQQLLVRLTGTGLVIPPASPAGTSNEIPEVIAVDSRIPESPLAPPSDGRGQEEPWQEL
jgi:hypothetical protein